MQNIFLVPDVPISIPSSLALEKEVMQQYRASLDVIKEMVTQETTLE